MVLLFTLESVSVVERITAASREMAGGSAPLGRPHPLMAWSGRARCRDRCVLFLGVSIWDVLSRRASRIGRVSPAAGISTGALIALGSAARLPVASAVVCATIACSLIE